MFKDYYAILEININATQNEIKKAYKTQAIKWHPDKNPGVDTTQRMQDINEAYLILGDIEAREKYNIQYRLYKQFKTDETKKESTSSKQEYSDTEENHNESHTKKEFTSDDDILNKWMANARRQATELAKQALDDYKNISIQAAAGAAIGCGASLYGYLISGNESITTATFGISLVVHKMTTEQVIAVERNPELKNNPLELLRLINNDGGGNRRLN